MKRRTQIIMIVAVCVVALGAVAAIAGPPIYRDFFAPTAAKTPTLTAEEGALTPSTGAETNLLDPATLTGTWTTTEGSTAGYRVSEVLGGTDVEATGTTSQVTGSLTTDGLSLAAAEFEVDVASITSDEGARDRYFRDQALNTAAHPTATFVLTQPVALDAAPSAGEIIEHEFTGDLTIAGVTKSVTFTVQARTDGTTAEVAGQIPITFQDFGVTAPNLGFVQVEPTGFVEFTLVFTKTP